MKIAIMTDTNSGIYKEEADQLGIFTIPMPIIIDDNVYYEGITISSEEFYEALTGGRNVSTSQPSIGDLMEFWDSIFAKGYDQIVYIPMSSGLSKSCETATICAAQDYEGRVFVADNHRIAVTQREATLGAKRMFDEAVKRGDTSVTGATIRDFLVEDAYCSTIYITPDSLHYLKKGGRITPAVAMLGTALNIKPILTIQGEKLDSFAMARSMKKSTLRMVEALKKDYEARFQDKDPEKMIVIAAGASLTLEEQQVWTKLLADAFPKAKVYYDGLSACIAVHTGPGAYGVGMCFLP